MPPAGLFSMTGQYTRVCFTVNLRDTETWDDFDINTLRATLNTSFLICGKETGAEGRKHFQGYLEFPKKVTGKVIHDKFRRTFPDGMSVHFEVAKGSATQNITYCSKEDTAPYTNGEPKAGQGTRTDLNEIMKKFKEGNTIQQIAEEHPMEYCRFRNGFRDFAHWNQQERKWPTKLIFIWGPTGTGKSTQAQYLSPRSVHWTGHYLNNYEPGTDNILFDDFDDEKMHWKDWLNFCDRHPHTVNIKGGSAQFNPRIIIFTSNTDPMTWYAKTKPETRAAIQRRMQEFGEFIHLEKPVDWRENTLTRFLKRQPVAQEEAAPVAAAAAAPTQQPGIHSLTSDEDKPPLSFRSRPRVIHVPESDAEDDDDTCSVDSQGSRAVVWSTDTENEHDEFYNS